MIAAGELCCLSDNSGYINLMILATAPFVGISHHKYWKSAYCNTGSGVNVYTCIRREHAVCVLQMKTFSLIFCQFKLHVL